MSFNIGGTEIGHIYIGSSEIAEVYIGSVKVFGASPQPPSGNQKTLIFQFNDASYDPNSDTWKSGAIWTRVSTSPNVWQYYRFSTDWSYEFCEQQQYSDPLTRFRNTQQNYSIINGDLTGITNAAYMFFDGSGSTTFYGLESVNVANSGSITNAQSMFDRQHQLASVYALDTSGMTNMQEMFSQCTALTHIPVSFSTASATSMNSVLAGTSLVNARTIDASSTTSLYGVLSGTQYLKNVNIVNTSNVTDFRSMFAGSGIEICPTFDTSSGRYLSHMFFGALALQYVPLFDLSSALYVQSAFQDCRQVISGALALYQAASQVSSIIMHTNMFTDCGISTTTGSQELSQIPASWGGTGS